MIIPFQADAAIKFTFQILRNLIVAFEGVDGMVSVFLPCIFETKIIDNESEVDGAGDVFP